jgi:hypothetical protein
MAFNSSPAFPQGNDFGLLLGKLPVPVFESIMGLNQAGEFQCAFKYGTT